MPSITTRNVPDATYQALRIRAAQNRRSMEAEVRAILESAVQPGFVAQWIADTEPLRGDDFMSDRLTGNRSVEL